MAQPPPVSKRHPLSVENAEGLEKLLRDSSTTSPTLIQYSATWCPRCAPLKEQIAEVLDGSVLWLCVNVEVAQELVLHNHITKLPRVDLYYRGKTQSVEGSAATLEGVQKMLGSTEIEPPSFELNDDF